MCKMSTVIKVLISIFCATTVSAGLFLAVVFYSVNLEPSKEAPQESVTVEPHQHPSLKRLADKLGIESRNLELKYYHPAKDEQGRFTTPDTIELKRGNDNQARVLAHEYYHYVWSQWPIENQREWSRELRKSYKQDYLMQQRMKWYKDRGVKGLDFGSELFAVYCSERHEYLLSKEFLKTCREFVPNRTWQTQF